MARRRGGGRSGVPTVPDYSFNASAKAWLLFGVCCPLFLALGFWQLERAGEKELINATRAARVGEAPIRLSAEMRGDGGDFRYRRVWMVGEYDAEHSFLVDNQVQGQAVGYHVLTPFRIDGGPAVLVNRGWVPQGRDRQQLPETGPLPAGRLRVQGTLDAFHRVGLRLKGAEIPAEGWPAVVQLPEADALSRRLGYPVQAYQVLLDPDAEAGYVRQWHAARLDPGKNRGYALQWFLFAAVAAFLFLRHGFTSRPARASQP